MSGDLKKPTLQTVELDDTFTGPSREYVNSNRGSSVPSPQPVSRTAVKVSGYTPMMQQSTAQAQFRTASVRITTPGQEGKKARDLLMRPGFEAQAEAQNMKISQYDRVGEHINRQSMAQDPARFTSGGVQSIYQPQEKITSTYIPSNQAYNNSSAQYIAELERNIGELRLENNQHKRTIGAREREIEDLRKETNRMNDENKNLLNELSSLGNLKNQLDETSMELDRICSDRDFHNEQHINLRNEILTIVKQEYEVDSLKREKAFIQEELVSYREKALIYEKQIDELTILAKRPVSQALKGTEQEERYYAKVAYLITNQ